MARNVSSGTVNNATRGSGTPVTPKLSSSSAASNALSDDQETRAILDQIQRSLTKMHMADNLTVKCKHQSETRILTVKKPANLQEMRTAIQEAYKRDMNIFYMLPNLELTTPIHSQADLDAAIKLIENSEKPLPLRLLLTDQSAPTLQQSISSQTKPSTVRPVVVSRNAMGSAQLQPAKAASAMQTPPIKAGNTAHLDVKASSVLAKATTLSSSISSNKINAQKSSKVDYDAEVTSLSSQTSNDSGIVKLAILRSESTQQVQSGQSGCEQCRNEVKLSSRITVSNAHGGGTFPMRVHSSATPGRIEVKDGRQTFPHIRDRESTNQQHNLACMCAHVTSSAQYVQPIRTPGSASSYNSYCSNSSTELDQRTNATNYPRSGLSAPATPVNWSFGEFIGGGAIGRVYKCLDKDSGKEFAVKKIPVRMESHDVARQLSILECEIQMLKTFTHERIVQYLGFSFSADQTEFFVFMEYLPGGSLKQQIRKYGPLTETLARKFTAQVLDALRFLHANQIVHRDIKSDNILSDSNGNVKLSDFSAAKQIQTICATSSIESAPALHSVIGTPYFMAPEVINGEGYSFEADVWSVGCTVVEMLTGAPPYSDFEPIAALFKIVTTDYPIFRLPPTSSPATSEFLRSTFIRDKRRRPSATDLLTHSFCTSAT